jgi:hypothetical protein
MRDKKNTCRRPALRAVRPNTRRRLRRLGCRVLVHAPLDFTYGCLDDNGPVGVVERSCPGDQRPHALESQRPDIDGVVPPTLNRTVQHATYHAHNVPISTALFNRHEQQRHTSDHRRCGRAAIQGNGEPLHSLVIDDKPVLGLHRASYVARSIGYVAAVGAAALGCGYARGKRAADLNVLGRWRDVVVRRHVICPEMMAVNREVCADWQ